jgi:hypothetical protein
MRYSGSKFRHSNYSKPHHGNAKKWYGKNVSHYRYGKYPYYRRYNSYPWYGASLYNYGAGCGWIYRKALSTGSDYWWDRYYRCARYSRYY